MNDKPFEYEWIPPDDDDIARGGHLPDKDEIAAKKAEFDRVKRMGGLK